MKKGHHNAVLTYSNQPPFSRDNNAFCQDFLDQVPPEIDFAWIVPCDATEEALCDLVYELSPHMVHKDFNVSRFLFQTIHNEKPE